MKCFFIKNQKVILFHKLKKNSWEAAASALREKKKLKVKIIIYKVFFFFLAYWPLTTQFISSWPLPILNSTSIPMCDKGYKIHCYVQY